VLERLQLCGSVFRRVAPDVAKEPGANILKGQVDQEEFLDRFNLEYEDPAFRQNVGNHSTCYMASHTRRRESLLMLFDGDRQFTVPGYLHLSYL